MTQVAPEPIAMAPMGQAMTDGADLTAILANVNTVYISQRADVLEGMCSCCNRANVYTGYSGKYKNLPDGVAPAPAIFIAKEESNCCERVFCCGKHGLVLRFHTAVPNELGGYTAGPDVFNTLERKGVCNGKPCLGFWNSCTCPCTDHCTEEMNMYKGNQNIEAPDPSAMLYQVKQPKCYEACCKFEVGVYAPNETKRAMSVVGPCCFGGWKGCLIGDDFKITDDQGDVGALHKHAPRDCMACIKEICTDADEYSVDFTPQEGMQVTPTQKLAMTTAAFMADFMIFEKDPGLCYCDFDNQQIVCNLCNCMICQRFQTIQLRIGADGCCIYCCK
jgi:hypothetical protein